VLHFACLFGRGGFLHAHGHQHGGQHLMALQNPLGNGFALCITGISWTDPAEWEKENLNSAKQHIDFMFGSEDMQAVVTTWDDREVQIFRDGKFCI